MSNQQKRQVIFDHDGGIDDLLSLLLLLRLPNIELIGICITPADCYIDDALLSTQKILSVTQNTHIPVSLGNIAGPNPFPPEWRAQPKMCNALPDIIRTSVDGLSPSPLPAHKFIHHAINATQGNVSVLITGPASNLAKAIELHPQIVEKIDEVVWMGGALEVKGNVAMHDHDQSAEWNAYWDPLATQSLLQSGVDLRLVPLDACNDLPVDSAFLKNLAHFNTPVSNLAGQFWAATVTAIPSYEFTYFLWDILSTISLVLPADKMTLKSAKVAVATKAPKAGQTYISAENGSSVSWISSVDADFAREVVTYYLCGEFTRKPRPFPT